MDSKAAARIIECMLDGIDPVTGEVLPDAHFCNNPDVLRALHAALMALEKPAAANCAPPTGNVRPNAGRTWTDEDSAALKSLYASGTPLDEICRRLMRRPRGVKKQLALLGLIPSDRAKIPGRERAGAKWTRAEDERLKLLFEQNKSNAEIALLLKRSTYAIHKRLIKQNLIDED